MKWVINFLSSSLGKKLMMALTGVFLTLFLTIHLLGNLQLLKSDDGVAFNHYAHFMSTNSLIQIVSKVNFMFIIGHALLALILTKQNQAARGPIGYVVTHTKSSLWASRNMGILGTILLVFIVIHLKDFYMKVHFAELITTTDTDGSSIPNVYVLVSAWFQKDWYVALAPGW